MNQIDIKQELAAQANPTKEKDVKLTKSRAYDRFICSLLKIFDREHIEMANASNLSEKEFDTFLGGHRDEVVLVNLRNSSYASSYENKRSRCRTEKIISIAQFGDKISSGIGRSISAPIAIFSDYYINTTNVVNIYVANTFLRDDDYKIDSNEVNHISKVYYSFLKYVGSNFDQISGWICRLSKGGDSVLDITAKLVSHYFKTNKILFWQSISIDEKTLVLSKIGDECSPDTLVDVFVEAVRMNAGELIFREKRKTLTSNCSCGDYVLFDTMYLYIPTPILDEILTKAKLKNNKIVILQQLYKRKSLIKSGEGFSVKIMVASQRREYYQFEKALFSEIGAIDIVKLGREEKPDVIRP